MSDNTAANTSPPDTFANHAFNVATRVKAFATLLIVLGIIGGAVVAAHEVESCSENYLGYLDCKKTHPNVGLGIGVAIACVFQMAVVIMIGTYIQARTREPGALRPQLPQATDP